MALEKTIIGGGKLAAGGPVPAGLRVSLSDTTGRTLPILKTPTLIGRTAGDLTVPHATVSSRHLVIERMQEGFAVIDQGSTNGTFLNQTRISPNVPYPIGNMDELRLGDVEFVFNVVEDRFNMHGEAGHDTGQTLITGSARMVAAIPEGQVVTLHTETGGSKHAHRLSLRITTVGRSEGDLNIDDQALSRRHFQIEVHPEHLAVKDLGSANGTHLGGKPFSYTIVEPGSVFEAGRTRFSLERSKA